MKYKQGNLISALETGEIDVLIQQSNCEGLSYFAGIAKSIHSKFKGLTETHVKHCKKPHVFGTSLIYNTDKGDVINLYSQLFRGPPLGRTKLVKPLEPAEVYTETTYTDSFDNRLEALKTSLNSVSDYLKDKQVGIPLLASGLGADRELKGTMDDLEYFKKYIAPIVERELEGLDITVFYL